MSAALARPAPRRFPYFEHRSVAHIDAQAERMRRFRAAQMTWCPAELREDYRLIVPYLGAVEARAIIERQIRDNLADNLTNATGYSFPRPVDDCRGVHRGAPAIVAAPFHSSSATSERSARS